MREMRRQQDRLEVRASELCVAAGIDPESRVGEGRGMPAWCTFRDAARQEQVLKEAAEVELPPQAAEYQNSPLKVFGTFRRSGNGAAGWT